MNGPSRYDLLFAGTIVAVAFEARPRGRAPQGDGQSIEPVAIVQCRTNIPCNPAT